MNRSVTLMVLFGFAFVQGQVYATDDPNTLGIYFDEAATINEAWIDVPGQIPAFLILTNPTMATIDGWWLGIDFASITHSYELTGGGVNMSDVSDPFYTSFFVEYPTPRPIGALTVLANLQVGVEEINPTACIRIGNNIMDDGYGFQDDPGAIVNGERVYFWPSVGWDGMPPLWDRCVAAINTEAPVAVEKTTWSGVKALFE